MESSYQGWLGRGNFPTRSQTIAAPKNGAARQTAIDAQKGGKIRRSLRFRNEPAVCPLAMVLRLEAIMQ